MPLVRVQALVKTTQYRHNLWSTDKGREVPERARGIGSMGGDAQGAFQSGTAKARTRMLRRLDEFATSSQDLFAAGRDASSNGIDLAKVVAFIKVSRRTVICWTLIGLALALLYSSTAVPEYT